MGFQILQLEDWTTCFGPGARLRAACLSRLGAGLGGPGASSLQLHFPLAFGEGGRGGPVALH